MWDWKRERNISRIKLKQGVEYCWRIEKGTYLGRNLERIFFFLFVSTSTPSHLSHTGILTIFHHGKSVQHTFCTAQLSVTGQSVLVVFVEMLFSLFLFSCVGI